MSQDSKRRNSREQHSSEEFTQEAQLPESVRLDEAAGEYQLDVSGKTAALRFRERAGDVVDLYSTFVPPEGRGEGVAARLVTVALDDLRAKGKKIVPSCSYVETYLDRHPEYRDLVA